MGQNEPIVLAAHAQITLRAVELLGDPLAGQARRLLEPAVSAEIDATPRMGWVPVRLLQRLFHAVRDAAGMQGLYRVCEGTMLRTFEQPLFRPLIEAATTIHLLEPVAVLRLACATYPLLYRNNGTLRLGERTQDSVELLLVGGAPSLVSDEIFMHAFGLGLQSTHRLSRPAATVQAIVRDRDAGLVRFVCSDGDQIALPQGLEARYTPTTIGPEPERTCAQSSAPRTGTPSAT